MPSLLNMLTYRNVIVIRPSDESQPEKLQQADAKKLDSGQGSHKTLPSINPLAAALRSPDARTRVSDAQQQVTQEVATYIQNYFQQYAAEHFPLPLHLSTNDLHALIMHQRDTLPKVAKDEQVRVNAKVHGCLNRAHCFELLQRGDDTAYEIFTSGQGVDKLPSQNFARLCHILQELPENARQAVRASCFMEPNQTLTAAVQEKIGDSLPVDPHRLLHVILQQAPDALRVYAALPATAQGLVRMACRPELQLEVMLSAAGGEGIFEAMRNSIVEGDFDEQAYAVWRAFWLLRLPSFADGQLSERYWCINDTVAHAFFDLCDEIDQLRQDPRRLVLPGYLQRRADKLELPTRNLAHLACRLRIFSPQLALFVSLWYQGQSIAQRRLLAHQPACHRGMDTAASRLILIDALCRRCPYINVALNIYVGIEERVDSAERQAAAAGTPRCTNRSYRELAQASNVYLFVEMEKKLRVPVLCIDAAGAYHIEGLVKT